MAEHLSLITSPIELIKNGRTVSFGTGFYYVSNWGGINHVFLVTNYHVITGNEVGKKKDGPKGDRVNFFYHLEKDNPASIMEISIPLFTDSKKRIWLEHENEAVDIAVIPLPYSLPMNPFISAIDKKWAGINMKIFPSDPVTVIGYPRMFLDKKNSLPIYKTGSIASEPRYDFDGSPHFIIDISAFSGNSGSPVFALSNGSYCDNEGNRVMSSQPIKKFLGVYSAGYEWSEELPLQKISKTENKEYAVVHRGDLQLGVVWRAELVQEIIDKMSAEEYKKTAEELIRTGKFNYRIAKDFVSKS